MSMNGVPILADETRLLRVPDRHILQTIDSGKANLARQSVAGTCGIPSGRSALKRFTRKAFDGPTSDADVSTRSC
jgi:hypothetical protein